MPDGSRDGEDGPVTRDPAARAADHAGIERLTDELLPALIAKLGTTRLGELEVREGDWRVRLRRPAPEAADASRRSGAERPSRSQPGHEGHGHAAAALEPHGRRATTAAPSGGNGSAPPLAAVGPGRADSRANGHGAPGAAHGTTGATHAQDPADALATSPAVGVFVPAPDLTSGMRVRAGDRLGIVDMLGVPQEVLAPVDGIVGEVLVEGGTAVEYGQELIRVELAAGTEAR